MALRLYDTRSRELRKFVPLQPGRVGMYVCGPTVQSGPHVGHLRSAVVFDVLRRWLVASGYEVTFVRNVTDIDDKIIINAEREGTSVWALAERYTREFNAAFDALGVLPPTIEPRATGHVPEMVALIERLIEAGYAYPADGSVWFAVGRFADYGQLSGQRPDALQASAENEPGKRDPRDFALWKAAKPGEPTWETPWGPGRPGWHLECSAMAGKYLGEQFDIHGGGLDLVFPHHENERAQTMCALDVGEMARWWVHHGLLTVSGGEKMSKSLGNFFLAADALATVRPVALRYFLLGAAHYRSAVEYGPEQLIEADAAYRRLETFVREECGSAAAPPPQQDGDEPPGVWDEFAVAMDDDLSVPRALAVVFAAVTAGHKASPRERRGYVNVVRRMLTVLGLDPVSQWPATGGELRGVLDTVMEIVLQARADARARRDYPSSDAIRARLAEAGIAVEDTPDGQRWRLAQ